MKQKFLPYTRWAVALALMAAVYLTSVAVVSADMAETAGVHSGTLSGFEKGIWLMWLDDNGKGRFLVWSDDSQLADSGTATANVDGSFSFATTFGIQGSGNILADGHSIGSYTIDGQTGSLEGLKQNSGALQKLAGSHTGTYSGSRQGTFIFAVARDGLISGSITASSDQLTEPGEGIINAKGEFIFLTRKDTSIRGSLDSTGKTKGVWSNPFWETHGTLSDGEQLPAGDNNPPSTGGDGTSGCFVGMLTAIGFP
jgi:hypothetical protein